MNSSKKSGFECEICGKILSRKDLLGRHVKSVHQKIEYPCPNCSYVANRKDHLKRHMNEVHLNLRSYVCEYCGMTFNQSGTMNRHITTVHVKNRNYDCPDCDSVFPRKDQLQRHIRSVHLNLRPHACKECGASFKLPGHLKQHIISIHTDQRQYICEYCGFAFKLRQHLNDHIKVVHMGVRPYACEECDSSFPHARGLKLHVIAMHSDEKPYVCEKCGRGFADPSHLYRHEQAEACWFTTTTAYKWEELCKEIAEVLLADEKWKWKPKIDTPELEEQSWIQPEIVAYYENNTIRIIDAKRSTYAIFKEKDLVVYPKMAEKVEFWCLYGKTEGMFEEEEGMEAKGSEEIIRELKKKIHEKNRDIVDILIMKIQLLKKGIAYENQTIL
ncbi:MAG: hypothetical protein GOP50_08195 [Candidatus Heimdallarchaeota archaeon]|nr:hypothetical protein [Candidatus Heimdallarchaeota archaeon]